MRWLTVTLALVVGIPVAAKAGPEVKLYAAGSLTGALGEAAKAYTQQSVSR